MGNTIEGLKSKLERCDGDVMEAIRRRDGVRDLLVEAVSAARVLTADDYKIVITDDDSWCWSSTDAMLADVLGDYSADEACGVTWQEHFKSKKAWLAARAAVEEENQRWVDAFENGDGISCYSACLYVRDPLDPEQWCEEPEDSCGGFFAVGRGNAPIDQIRDQLEPREFAGKVEIEEFYG